MYLEIRCYISFYLIILRDLYDGKPNQKVLEKNEALHCSGKVQIRVLELCIHDEAIMAKKPFNDIQKA